MDGPTMCGRYRLSQAERFAEINDIRPGITFRPRYNGNREQRNRKPAKRLTVYGQYLRVSCG
jgi:hypothetical protein